MVVPARRLLAGRGLPHTFSDAPQADVLMVPGGRGAFELMDDPNG